MLGYRYDNDSDMSSASFVSDPPSEHDTFYSTTDKDLADESRRLVQDLDARIAELSSANRTTITDDKKPGKCPFLSFFFSSSYVD